jgi:hypothetical protein
METEMRERIVKSIIGEDGRVIEYFRQGKAKDAQHEEFIINDQRDETVILAVTQRHLFIFQQETAELTDSPLKPYSIPILDISAITTIQLSPKLVGQVTIKYHDDN